MTLNERSLNIKFVAADLLTSLSSETLHLPIIRVVRQSDKSNIYKLFRYQSIGSFLKEVCSLKGNVPKPYCIVVDILSSTFTTSNALPIEEVNTLCNPKEAPGTTILGTGDAPLCERLLAAINGAIYQMKNGGHKGYKRQAAVIEHFCNSSGNFDSTAKEFGCSRQNVEQAVRRFNSLLLEGNAWCGLAGRYTIDPNLLKEVHEVAYTLTGHLLSGLKHLIGTVEGTSLSYILRMLDCEVATIGNRQFVIERGKIKQYMKIADTARRALSKSVEAISLNVLTDGLTSGDSAFLIRYLSITPGIKFLDRNSVIMTGKGLDQAVRQARIIYEADGWVSKEDISIRYESEYNEPMGTFAPAVLHKLGCTNHNKLGYWTYSTEKVSKIKDIILTIMTSEKPIATFATIYKAILTEGLLYPEKTIRACITDLACPENRNHDLFCLKGYTHLYPSLSWRSYKKLPA